jgi:hypothetical protein
MGIVDVFQALGSALINHTKDKAQMQSLRKDDVITILEQNIEMHKANAETLAVMSAQEMNSWMLKVTQALNDTPGKSRDVYDRYCKGLSSSASSLERKCFLSSLKVINADLIPVLNEILKNIDSFMENDKVELYETKMSQLAILGICRDSTRIATFTQYLYTYLIRVTSDTYDDIPRYREEYMLDNVDRVSKIVSNFCDHKGYYNFNKDMTKIRRQNADLILGANGKFSFNQYLGSVRNFYTADILDSIMSALSCLNLYDHVMNFIDDYKLERNSRNKETKEWLETHVAVLRMELAEKDKSSKEYAKLENIIKAYDAKITEYDEAIQAFENGD